MRRPRSRFWRKSEAWRRANCTGSCSAQKSAETRRLLSRSYSQRLLRRRRMVVDDPPSARHLFHDQSKQAMRVRAIRHREVPASGNHRSSTANDIDVEVLKLQLAHLLALTLVSLAIAL